MEKQNMDLYLFIPCDLKNFHNIEHREDKKSIGNFLIDEVRKNNQNEFKSEYVKCLNRYNIGKYNFKFCIDNKEFIEEGILTITKHPKTSLGVINLFINNLKNSPGLILDSFLSCNFLIDDSNINDWAIKNNISFLGTFKALLFSFLPVSQDNMLSILACERGVGIIKGKEFISMANNDIAQYNMAEVYCSENVLLELQKQPIEDLNTRISMEAVEIFFMELLVLQDAAISRICNKILKELEIETKNPLNVTNTDILDILASELSESILFLDFDNFVYPTVRISAEKIARSFRLDKQIEKYNRYKELLESLINIRKNKIEDLESGNMNVLLLLLTLTQIIPVLIEMFEVIINKTLSLSKIVSFISSIAVCSILLLIFKIINKRKKKKYKSKLLNLRI